MSTRHSMAYVKSKCSKCGAIILDNCCVGCGYMTNGNYTGKNFFHDRYEDLKIYDDSFYEMSMNKKLPLIFVMEFSYFCYRGHLLFGLFVGLVDLLVTYRFISTFSIYFNSIFNFLLIGYLFFKKMVYVLSANTICLKLDSNKIKRIKKRYLDYKPYLLNHNDKDLFKVIMCLIGVGLVFFVILVYKWMVNGYL